jgi:hypothetical protein
MQGRLDKGRPDKGEDSLQCVALVLAEVGVLKGCPKQQQLWAITIECQFGVKGGE